MINIDDKSFFDLLFSQFAKTTQAETAFWMSEEDATGEWVIWAVSQDQSQTMVAHGMSEPDADFIAAIAGCFPDLVRRLHAALDEADRLDVERDEREREIGRLTLENQELLSENDAAAAKIQQLEAWLATAKAENSYHRPLG